MVRDTSKEAYQEIKENGLLTEARMRVYSWLYRHGPCTGAELSKAMGLKDTTQGNVRARLGELRDQCVVDELGLTFCTVSGHRVIKWGVNKNIPKKVKTKTKLQKLQAKLIRQKAEVNKTKAAIRILTEDKDDKAQVDLF